MNKKIDQENLQVISNQKFLIEQAQQMISPTNLLNQIRFVQSSNCEKSVKIKLLRGLQKKLKQSIQLQNNLKDKLKRSNSNIIVIHQRTLSQSTNLSFDNIMSVSQVNSIAQKQEERKKKEIFDSVIQNYSKQIQDREYMLIALKKEKYHIINEMEDSSDDLNNLKIILDHFKQEIVQKEKFISSYFDEINRLTKQKSKTTNNSAICTPGTVSQSSSFERNKSAGFGLFKGFFGKKILNKSLLEENYDKISARTTIQKNTQSSGEN